MNRHSKSTLQRLYVSCRRRAEQLMEGPARIAEQDLAHDTAQLLLAATERFDFTLGPPFPDQQLARGEDFLEVFNRFYVGTLRDARYRTVLAAATAVHGDKAIDWLSVTRLEDERVFDRALASDSGLSLAIAHLERVHAGRAAERQGVNNP